LTANTAVVPVVVDVLASPGLPRDLDISFDFLVDTVVTGLDAA